ncbi:hypothetical protein CPB86DRAFT_803179 [Serendipita vermifera]|nr:hypothetical protein CPB86DRAFT_803179 [Serendipita vermifera]
MDISKTIIDLWNTLDPTVIFEWEELVRDIKNAYAQLVSRFGNGVVFYGDNWEDQRCYHARSLFFKWMGYQYQSMYGTAPVDDPTTILNGRLLAEQHTSIQFVDALFHEGTDSTYPTTTITALILVASLTRDKRDTQGKAPKDRDEVKNSARKYDAIRSEFFFRDFCEFASLQDVADGSKGFGE